MANVNEYFVRASLTAAGSVSIIASVTGSRWKVQDGIVTFCNCTATMSLTLYEYNSAVTVAMFKIGPNSNGGGSYPFFIEASDTYSSLHMADNAAGTAQVVLRYVWN